MVFVGIVVLNHCWFFGYIKFEDVVLQVLSLLLAFIVNSNLCSLSGFCP